MENTPQKAVPAELQNVAKMVKLMDSQFRIPGTSITFGLDPLIGLIPGLGNLVDYVISAYLLIAMVQNSASGKVVAKMIVNITIDALVGLIPVLGRLFDIFYKANQKNLVLAIEHYREGKHQGSAWSVIGWVFAILAFVFLVFLALTFWNTWNFITAIISWSSGSSF